MKKVFRLFLMSSALFLFGADLKLKASCESINGKPDNGKCDKTDVNNKMCVDAQSGYDCYIPPGPPGGGQQ